MKKNLSIFTLIEPTIAICLVIISFCFVSGCNSPVEQSELYGTYIAEYDVARERLDIDKDGTFTQSVIIVATAKTDKIAGRWLYNPQTGYISFENNFMLILDGFGHFDPQYNNPTIGRSVYPVEKSFGRVRIGVDVGNEVSIIYIKQ